MTDDGSLWIVVPTGQQAAGGWIDDTLKQRAIEQGQDARVPLAADFPRQRVEVIRGPSAEARLQELQNELVHVSRLTALGEMASALAHELNQPLSAIANYLTGSRTLLARDEVPHERVADAIGRRKLVMPTWEALAATPDGLAFARRVYAEAKPRMHPITSGSVESTLAKAKSP